MSPHVNAMLTLVMIVKDEAKTIARTLRSAAPVIDRWVILDTGSTDGTQDVIRAELAGIPGELHEEPFVDFSTSRNRALDLAGQATEFVLCLDADDEVQGGPVLRAFLEQERAHRAPDREAYYVRVCMGDDGSTFDSPRLSRTSAGWRYRGAVHEILMHPDRPPPAYRAPEGVLIHHRPSGDSPERSRRRWERDVALFEAALATDPGDTRSAFYLAQSLLWLGRAGEAEAAFQRRIALGGWTEEVYESKMAMARLAEGQGRPWAMVEQRYLDAFRTAPHRAEPLHAIAAHYQAADDLPLAFLFARRAWELPFPSGDRLFVDPSVYAWKAADIVASVGWWLREFELGLRAAKQAAAGRPEEERLKRNLAFYENRLATGPA